MSLESNGGMILTGENRRSRRKTCPSATLSTTNPTWLDPRANPGLRGERPATNDQSHGTTQVEAITTGWSLVQRSPTDFLNKITKPPVWGVQGPYKDSSDDDVNWYSRGRCCLRISSRRHFNLTPYELNRKRNVSRCQKHAFPSFSMIQAHSLNSSPNVGGPCVESITSLYPSPQLQRFLCILSVR
jgi:hypothetical protein